MESYQIQLWASNRRAAGFHQCFAAWWQTRATQLRGSPLLPLGAPCTALAQLIVGGFRSNHRKFESWHLRQRSRAMQLKLPAQSSGTVIQDDRPASVDTLSMQQKYTVLGVDAATNQVHLNSKICTAGCFQWTLQGQPADVQFGDADTAQINSDLLLCARHPRAQQTLHMDGPASASACQTRMNWSSINLSRRFCSALCCPVLRQLSGHGG